MKTKETRKKKVYKRPEVKTTSADKLLKKIGPAQTCSPSPSECPASE